MNSKYSSGLMLLAALICIAPASAVPSTFTGTISGVVSGGIHPFEDYFLIGQPIWGSYSYKSESIDGTFNAFDGDLKLIIRGAFSLSELDIGLIFPLEVPQLTVTDGVVTRFIGGGGLISILLLPPSSVGSWDFDSFGGGPIRFSDPKLMVPDAAPTLGMFAIAMVGLLLTRISNRRAGRMEVA